MPENPLDALPVLRAGPETTSARAVTVLLHGRGRKAEEMLDLAGQLALPEMSFVALTAAHGTWYPESFLAPRGRNEPHLGWALERIEALIEELERDGVPRARIAWMGFSQGACLATEYVFRSPSRWGGLAALTGGLIGPLETTWETAGDLAGTPVLLTTSDVDEWVPLARVKMTADVFRSMHAEVDLRVYPGRSHVVSLEEIEATRSLLARLLESLAPR
jgi:phospholipase/carboxylesterase